MLSKKEIEKAKEILQSYENKLVYEISGKDKEAVKTLLQYIDQLEADNYELNNRLNDYIENDNKQNKIIDEILKAWKQDDYRSIEEIKQYFEKKVEEK